MKTPTLSDVALAAGVSYATADRVANKRGNVAEKSVRKVTDAMVSLGYVRNVAAANLSKGRVYKLVFLLPRRGNAFFDLMRDHLSSIASYMIAKRISIEVVEFAAFTASALKECLEKLAVRDVDGVAVVGLQSKEIVQPLNQLRRDGVAVVGLVSDLPENLRSAYVGIDNISAGRTAARLVGISHGGRRGRVQMFGGSFDARDHKERALGFAEVIRSDFPEIELLDPIMTNDDAEQLESMATAKLVSDKGITAFYNLGAGNRGLYTALRAHGRPKPFFCVVHELVSGSKNALSEGLIDVVVDQQPDVEVQRAISMLRALIDNIEPLPQPDLVPAIFVRDNLPRDTKFENEKDPM